MERTASPRKERLILHAELWAWTTLDWSQSCLRLLQQVERNAETSASGVGAAVGYRKPDQCSAQLLPPKARRSLSSLKWLEQAG